MLQSKYVTQSQLYKLICNIIMILSQLIMFEQEGHAILTFLNSGVAS